MRSDYWRVTAEMPGVITVEDPVATGNPVARARSTRRNALLACIVPFLLSCAGPKQPCFEQSSLILDPRILAVRTDPPASVVDPSDASSLSAIKVSALVVTGVANVLQEYGSAVQIKDYETIVSVCLIPPISAHNAQPGCPDGSQVVADLPVVPDLDSPFIYTPTLDLVHQAIEQDPLHGLAGVLLRMQIVVRTTPPISASKTLTLQLKNSPATLNHGLEIVGIEMSEGGNHVVRSVSGGVDLTVAVTKGIRPLVAPGIGGTDAVETYVGYDDTGALVTLQEHVTYAFYAGNALFFGTTQSGGTAIYTGAPGDVADEPPPGAEDPPDGLVSVEPVFVGNQTGGFWVVARDGRGAEAWAEIPYSALDPRPCAVSYGPQAPAHCPALLFGCN